MTHDADCSNSAPLGLEPRAQTLAIRAPLELELGLRFSSSANVMALKRRDNNQKHSRANKLDALLLPLPPAL